MAIKDGAHVGALRGGHVPKYILVCSLPLHKPLPHDVICDADVRHCVRPV